MTDWTPTRQHALGLLEDFLPHAGRDYAASRNFDLGPGDRSNVSGLSPYVRHRLIREEEIVSAVRTRHSSSAAEKFLQEVVWRTYWKGWLEIHPGVWPSYRDELTSLTQRLETDLALNARYSDALSGKSGLTCLDQWVRELIENGYLHNHARMWFASLWIFTLKLPWALGADFFYRHLLDGDPASNTLSWRWVAGLQTKGKTYAAQAENIDRYTQGRIRPQEPFASECLPIRGSDVYPTVRLKPRDRVEPGTVALLITEEDLHVESLHLPGTKPVAVAGVQATSDRSRWPTSPLVQGFASGALADGLQRAGVHFDLCTCELESWEHILDWAKSLGVNQVVTAEASIGPVRDRLQVLEASLLRHGVRLVRIRRDWDDALWPLATKGFFPFKEKLPTVLASLGLG